MGKRAFHRKGYQNQEIQVIPGDYYIPFQGASGKAKVLGGTGFSRTVQGDAGFSGEGRGKGPRGSGFSRTAQAGELDIGMAPMRGRQRGAANTYSGKMLSKRRKEKRRRKIRRLVCGAAAFCLLLTILPAAGNMLKQAQSGEGAGRFLERLFLKSPGKDCPEELLEMLEKNEETYDFVAGYPDRADYMGKEIDLSGEVKDGAVPLLMQWDKRWGYDSYGQELVAVAGCGPTCMAMAYLYLKGDTSMNPREMAEYAYGNGYYTEAGTSWDFFTSGAAGLGLVGSELPLGEAQIKNALDAGNVVVCSMRPGDFTTTGHFILLTGYDENGFSINDPNSRKNSGKQWDYDRLGGQIKCLWSIGK